MLDHVGRIVTAVGVPVTADLEAGYGDTADDVGRTVARAIEQGVVGANLEDAAAGGLFGIDEACDRLAAARAVAPRSTFVLNARTDTYFAGTTGDVFAETVERAVRYVEVGSRLRLRARRRRRGHHPPARRRHPRPRSTSWRGCRTPSTRPRSSRSGVKRVSLGGSLARAALSTLERAGQELLDSGTLGFLDGAIGYADLQQRFGA